MQNRAFRGLQNMPNSVSGRGPACGPRWVAHDASPGPPSWLENVTHPNIPPDSAPRFSGRGIDPQIFFLEPHNSESLNNYS